MLTSLQRLRILQGYKQNEMARKIGVQPANVSLWERGDGVPNGRIIQTVAKAYGCTVDELIAHIKSARTA